MSTTTSYRTIWDVAYPLMLSGVATTVINVMDTAFLGRVSDVALGAAGLGGIYFLVFLMASVGLGIGAQIIIARFFGETNHQRIGDVFDHLLYLMFGLAIALIGLHHVIASPLLSQIISSPDILQSTEDYLNIRTIGFLPAFILVAYRSFLTGISNTRAISYAAAIMAIVNVILNYLLVFGKFGFPRLEVEGAAIASVISEFVSTAFIILWVKFRGEPGKYNCYQFSAVSIKQLKNILNISAPMVVQHVISLSSWLAFFLIIEGMGERPLAISNVVRSSYSVLMVPLLGIGQAGQSLVSKLIGEGKQDQMWLLIRRLMLVSMASTAFLVVLNLMDIRILLRVFSNDPSLITECRPVINVISISIMLFSVGMILLATIAGTGNTKITLLIEVLTLSFYLCYTYAAVKVWAFPLHLVWTSEIVYFLCMALFSALYLWTGRWKNTKVHD